MEEPNVKELIIAIIFAFIIVWLVYPYIQSDESVGWSNTQIACNWCFNGSGCSCSGIAGWCVEEYKKAHNLTDAEFPTYIIRNDELPPLW